MANRIDARGLSCPQPVVMTKKALKTSKALEVLVDNRTAMENVSRFARHSGCDVDVEPVDNDYIVRICAKRRA